MSSEIESGFLIDAKRCWAKPVLKKAEHQRTWGGTIFPNYESDNGYFNSSGG